jgi:hypothetical protein
MLMRAVQALRQSFPLQAPGPQHANEPGMSRPLLRTSPAPIAPSWDATPFHARCVEPDGDPTEVIPVELLRQLLAQTGTEEVSRAEGGAPRFEIVEIDPEDVVVDDSSFEEAFEAIQR